MLQDPIVEEVRRHRDEYAKQFNYDLQAIYQDLKQKQEKSGRKIVSFPPKPVQPMAPAASSAAHRTNGRFAKSGPE